MNAARICSLLCLAWILAFFPRDAPANEPNQVRLAVGPFSDSDGNQSFKDAVTLLPDLLTARLSADGRFQLLERQRISELWNELNLTVNGLDSSTTMLKLGKVLACDWFVTGSFVTTGTNTQIWVTVINTRDGVVRDVRLFPFQRGKVDDLAGQITAFLDQVQTNELPMKFIALGRFLDMSTSSKHEDWSWRLRTLIETRFRATGYSVVDNETVSPLFDEFQLQQAGFSESETNRVRFKTPFWLVDGLCKWVRDTNDELSVAIRIRQLGAGEYVIHLRAAPGAEMESNILNAIAVQLAGTNQVSAGAATLAEADLYSKEFQAVTRGKMVMPPARSSNTGAAPAVQPDRQDMRSEGLKESERAYLLDTNNLNAKFEVAMIYFSETNDPALQDRGDQMLEELMRCTNIFVAHRAYYPLAYGYAEFDRKQLQMVMLVKPRIKPDLQYEMNYQRQVFQITTNSLELSLAQHPHDDKAKLALGYALFNNNDDTLARRQGRRLLEELSTNDNQIISERAATVLQSLDAPDNRPTNSIQTPNLAPIPQSPPLDPTVRWPAYTLVDSFDGGQFRVVWDNGWLVNKGEKLSFYDRQDGKTDVPCPVNRAITALAADYKFWWV
ncbi:MAG TPA: CsgG/HfaB family protein, partial [Candidatus Acidoferrum sp.]|nr:CsgG/HfaB family protein [Candidatus Acidoferrum sp.]